jgi:spermidine/putrescine transport system permease protein
LAFLLVFSFGYMDPVLFQIHFGWTTSNYTSIFHSIYLHTLIRSLVLSGSATLICLLIGYPVALAISRQPKRRQYVLILAIMLPFWTSFVVRTYAWIDILSPHGPVGNFMASLGLGRPAILFTPVSIAIGMAYGYLPLMVLPIYVSLERLDVELLDAAADLGAGGWRTLRRVIIPLSFPGVVAGCLLVAIPTLGEYVIPAILGGGKTLMYGNIVADQFLETPNYPFGAALAITLMIGLGIVLVVGRAATAAAGRAQAVRP